MKKRIGKQRNKIISAPIISSKELIRDKLRASTIRKIKERFAIALQEELDFQCVELIINGTR